MFNKIDQLVNAIRDNAPNNCVEIHIDISSEGYYVSYDTRTAKSLKKDEITMRDVRGNVIEDDSTDTLTFTLPETKYNLSDGNVLLDTTHLAPNINSTNFSTMTI